MNLRDLKYLVALADHRHFGKAAEASFVSQPTLSTVPSEILITGYTPLSFSGGIRSVPSWPRVPP